MLKLKGVVWSLVACLAGWLGGAEVPSIIAREATFWLDAADPSTLTVEENGEVSAWASKAGDERTCRPYLDNKPVYDTTTYGLPTVDFGVLGSDRDLNYPRVTHIRTAFFVVKILDKENQFLLADSATYHFHRGQNGQYGNKSYAQFENVWNGRTPRRVWWEDHIPDDAFQVICVTMKTDAQSDRLTYDRNCQSSEGRRNGGKQLSELITFSTVLNDADRLAVTDYLAAKWGALAVSTAPEILKRKAEVHYSTAKRNSFTFENGQVVGWRNLSDAGADWDATLPPRTTENIVNRGTWEFIKGVPVYQMGESGSHIDLGFQELANVHTAFWAMDIKQRNEAFFLGHTDKYDFHRGTGGEYGPVGQAGWGHVNDDFTEIHEDGQIVPYAKLVPTGLHVYSMLMETNCAANRLTSDRDCKNDGVGRDGGRALSEVAIFSAELSSVEHGAIDRYFMDKWYNMGWLDDDDFVFHRNASGDWSADAAWRVDGAAVSWMDGGTVALDGADIVVTLAETATVDGLYVRDNCTVDGTGTLAIGANNRIWVAAGKTATVSCSLQSSGILVKCGEGSLVVTGDIQVGGVIVEEGTYEGPRPNAAEWTGAGMTAAWNDPANWVVRGASGEIVAGAVPGMEHDVSINGRCELAAMDHIAWKSLTLFTDGRLTIDVAGCSLGDAVLTCPEGIKLTAGAAMAERVRLVNGRYTPNLSADGTIVQLDQIESLVFRNRQYVGGRPAVTDESFINMPIADYSTLTMPARSISEALQGWLTPWQGRYLAVQHNRYDGWFEVTPEQAGSWTITSCFDDYVALAIDGSWAHVHKDCGASLTTSFEVTAGWHHLTVVFGDTGGDYGASELAPWPRAYAVGVSINGGELVKFSDENFRFEDPSAVTTGDFNVTAQGETECLTFDVAAGCRLVVDPARTQLHLLRAPSFATGAKFALSAGYAQATAGRFCVMTWDLGQLELPTDATLASLFDATSAQGRNVAVEVVETQTGYALWLDLDTENTIATAEWTGSAQNGDLADPLNWTCFDAEGNVVDGAAPPAGADVVIKGPVDLQIPAGKTPGWKSVTFAQVRLTADCDWRGFGTLVVGDGQQIDLDGHKLTLSGLQTKGSGQVCDLSGRVFYNYYRFKIDHARGNEQQMQISEFQLLDGAEDVTRTYANLQAGINLDGNEGAAKMFDGRTDTKCYSGSAPEDLWFMLEYAAPQPVTGYRWYTANDTQTYNGRNPRIWRVQGSNDGATWTDLDVVDEEYCRTSNYALGYQGALCDPEVTRQGELCFDVSIGNVLDTAGMRIGGNLRLVKQGPGLFLARGDLAYAGSTQILEGPAKPAAVGVDGIFGLFGADVIIGAAATLDLDGWYDFQSYNIVLDGGLLQNTRWTRGGDPWTVTLLRTLRLTADSRLELTQPHGLLAPNYSPATLDLGGHTLTVNANQIWYLSHVTATTPGTILLTNGGVEFLRNTSDFSLVRFESAGRIRVNPNMPFAILGDYVASETVPEDANAFTGLLKVTKTFRPNTDLFHGCELQHGAVLDLSSREGTFDTAGANSALEGTGPNQTTVTFAENATVLLDLGDRRDVCSNTCILSWPEDAPPPATTNFKMKPGSSHTGRLLKLADGLYYINGLTLYVR